MDINDALERIEKLVAKSLVRRVSASGLVFELIPLVRHWVARETDDNPLRDDARNRYADYVFERATTYLDDISRFDESATSEGAGLVPDLRLALSAIRDPEKRITLHAAIGWALWFNGAVDACAAALEAAQHDLGEPDTCAASGLRLHLLKARIGYLLGPKEMGLEPVRCVEARARELNDTALWAEALALRASRLINARMDGAIAAELAEALGKGSEALAESQPGWAAELARLDLHRLSLSSPYGGEADTAVSEAAERCLSLARRSGSAVRLGRVSTSASYILYTRGVIEP
ncbi:MAG: hypothetical protein KC561_21200, partial [Myxococcales bacterium]|nr:hypothetical protein [Myxococcales bacterium]